MVTITPADGWHFISEEEPKEHYFLGGKSTCGKYPTLPTGASHDNVPDLHCMDCVQGLREALRGSE